MFARKPERTLNPDFQKLRKAIYAAVEAHHRPALNEIRLGLTEGSTIYREQGQAVGDVLRGLQSAGMTELDGVLSGCYNKAYERDASARVTRQAMFSEELDSWLRSQGLPTETIPPSLRDKVHDFIMMEYGINTFNKLATEHLLLTAVPNEYADYAQKIFTEMLTTVFSGNQDLAMVRINEASKSIAALDIQSIKRGVVNEFAQTWVKEHAKEIDEVFGNPRIRIPAELRSSYELENFAHAVAFDTLLVGPPHHLGARTKHLRPEDEAIVKARAQITERLGGKTSLVNALETSLRDAVTYAPVVHNRAVG